MTQKSEKDWFVLCTKAHQELKVLERLSQLGKEIYIPTKTVVKHWSGQKRRLKPVCYHLWF